MARLCNARTRAGGLCRQPIPGRRRCLYHGGKSTGPRTAAGMANTVAALKAGRERWLQRMRLAKAQGLIEKFPNGNKLGARRMRSPERRAAWREWAAEKEIEMAWKQLPAVSDKPVAEMSSAELFADNVRKSLCFNREVLAWPVDRDDLEILKLKKEIALGTQAQAVRIRVAELQPRGDDSVVELLMKRVAVLRRRGSLTASTVIDVDADDNE